VKFICFYSQRQEEQGLVAQIAVHPQLPCGEEMPMVIPFVTPVVSTTNFIT